jgi:ATP-dependent Clp protease ATP-binding subunit ClpC
VAGMDQFTSNSRHVLSLAQKEAERLRKAQISTAHLLVALILEEKSIASRVLRDLGLQVDRVRAMVEEETGFGEHTGQITLSPGMQQVLPYAINEANKKSQKSVDTEHLLLGLIRLSNCEAMNILGKLGVTPEQIRRQINRVSRESQSDSRPALTGKSKGSSSGSRRRQSESKKDKEKTPLVDQLATDLTTLAEENKLDPVIGRQTEIERVIQILARRTKNNPALIGEPGVGKTAIVEGLAQRIIEGDVPAPLLDKRLLQLDVGSLVAGTMYRGQFEERLKRVIDELKSSDAILFIDEVHMLVGAGSAGSSVDAANILKPALSRGELQVIGATTLEEYRKNIESDAALERRFQPILVNEPTVEETIEILHGIRNAYEDHHRLTIEDEALESAAKLSARYVSDRFLPDKAIDLIDESASRVRMYKSPAAINAKELIKKLRSLRKQLEEAQSEDDLDTAAELKGHVKKLEHKLEDMRTIWDRKTSPHVTAEDIAEVISMWTGVPLMQLATEESARLLNMEEKLREHIIGQDEAIETVSKAIRRARAGLKDPDRPVGSFIFLGPTGVGKTELTKALANFMFGSEDALIQLDMSEFMERHSVSRLVGAPPGYVGYEDAGQLTEAIRRKPYSIVVFDEIEKAHPEAHNMLLQIMEEGHLTDARGHKVDFRNAIIIMTTNVGADMIRRQSSLGFSLTVDANQEETQAYDEMRKKLMDALKRTFRPEFINRLDGVIVFRSLNQENIRQIVQLELDKVSARLEENNISLKATPEALSLLAEEGYNPDMGARPLRRVIQRKIEDKLSDGLLANQFQEGHQILIDVEMKEEDGQETKEIILRDNGQNGDEKEEPDLAAVGT